VSEQTAVSALDLLASLMNEKCGVLEADVAEDTVLESLDLDSLALVELFVVIQKRWGVVIELGEIKGENTAGELATRLAAGLA
jgi:acyl carrier protein